MPRAATTTDAFAAIAEPRRRDLLEVLAGSGGQGDGQDVSWLVEKLGWPQPQVSKHLGVLLRVRLVNVVQVGRRRMYSVNGPELRPVYDWVKAYEKFWDHQLGRIKQRAEQAQQRALTKADTTQ